MGLFDDFKREVSNGFDFAKQNTGLGQAAQYVEGNLSGMKNMIPGLGGGSGIDDALWSRSREARRDRDD